MEAWWLLVGDFKTFQMFFSIQMQFGGTFSLQFAMIIEADSPLKILSNF